jgi:16S rRNA (adenine1518-N6/adenine1519-N6)-dimethyltransferase
LPRRLGQHFLARKSILNRIAAAACPNGAERVIEIGPGKGALTESLLDRAERVIAIEIDPYLVHYLRQKFREPIDEQRLTVIEGDILKTDLAAFGPTVIAGNLPYYITSPILEHIFSLGGNWLRAAFLVQAEVAARLASPPGSRDYGFLSVQAQLYAHVETLFPVARRAFRPPPKVDSAVVSMEPRDAAAELGIADRAAFLHFASAAFRHKRKTLRNNLAPVYGKDRVDAIAEMSKRAEQLSLSELAGLFRKLSAA